LRVPPQDPGESAQATLSKFHARTIGAATPKRYAGNRSAKETTVRISFTAAALCFCLMPPAGAVADSSAAAATPVSSAPNADAAAAAKHAKLTACRKDAKTKKLVGAEKTAYLEKCLAAK
jgi:hypothetical protein